MNRVFLIALNDLRLFLREKSSYFWLFGTPLLFSFFMGFANRGPGNPSNPRPPIQIENQDRGFLGELFVEELGVQGLTVQTNDVSVRAERKLRIPADLTEQVLAKTPVKLELFDTRGSRQGAGAMVEIKVVRALIAMNGYLLEQAGGLPLTEETLRKLKQKPNPVQLKASFATRKPLPAGPHQAVPGVLAMFILMNLLIFGGVTIAEERRGGVLKRLLVNPLSARELVVGKIAGSFLLGVVQIAVLLLAGKFLMRMDFAGNLGWVIVTCLIYAWAAGALGLLIGSVVAREDKVVPICVLASMVMAALGGSWWPLEIVPDNVRLLGHLFPTAWAMDAFHQLLSFGGSFAEIWKQLAILTAYALASSIAAIRFFRA